MCWMRMRLWQITTTPCAPSAVETTKRFLFFAYSIAGTDGPDRNVARKKASVWIDTSIDIEQSKKLRPRESGMYPWVMSPGPGYFTAVGIPVLQKSQENMSNTDLHLYCQGP